MNWRISDGKWSLLEIVCHLVDEEIEDFRARVDHCLHRPEAPMTPIDPQGWVLSRKYSERDYAEMCARWKVERQQSLQWLNALHNPDWSSCHHHPKLGEVSAFFFLANWVEHDYLHMRQILNLKHHFLAAHCSSGLYYAGEWTSGQNKV
ncbi:MAG: DinB family protein [Flavobacteriales bacterium]|nr:DinB family protein [Flavobacteriales bacterium]